MEQDFLEDRPTNHREDANFLSALLFWWTFKIFNLGKKRDLFESDLPEPLREHKASTLGDKISRLWSIENNRAKLRQQTPSLTRVLTQCFFWEYMLYGMLLAFMELLVKPTQPLFIGLLVRYFTAENSQNTNPEAFPMYLSRMFYYNHPNQCAIQRNEAILYASCIVLCSIASVIFQHPYMLSVMHIGMKIRVACTSLMYRKTLRMSMLALSPTTVGNVVNLMSNDATRFDVVTMFLHYLWVSPIQMIMFTYILYTHVGTAAYVGACVIAIFIPVQMILAYFNKNLRWKTAFKTDERVRLMNEIIAGIQVIKMYAWEYAFCKLVNVARRLHDEMFESIVFGQMRFFNTNPSGRILNRFSKDMGSVDEDLPYAMIDFCQMFLNLIGVIIILSATNYYLLPPIILITTALVLLRRYYLKTSRSLKRVEGVVRSAVFAHLNASIQGLSTIRTHRAEEILTYEFDKHMDLHSSAWYLFISTARAFSLWMDGLCVVLITLASYGFILLQTVFNMDVMAGDVGLCITQCISLTGLIPWGMRQSAEMENQMTSVERIIDFTNIDHEPDLLAPERPPANWPSDGEIIFKETTLRYSLREEPVLKGLNFVIRPKEKIGIVGRTGAGKSSLISALFRLAYQSGSIIIDGIDIFNIGLHDVRRKIAIIPQEPVIFTGTMRFNLDPFRKHSDEVLLSALSTVDLEPGTRNILNQSLVEGGASLSAGEKQLLCLARAIVRNNRILILDEATSNMDAETDRLIQKTIRTSFDQCTVLTIAHRLYTIMDYDRVLVMHAGIVVEFDHPHNLLQIKDGYLTSMVNQTGKQMAQFLRKIAEDTFKNNGPSNLAALDQFNNPEDN